MKEKILQKSTELFLTLGFKSVTMDDIAQELGVSKKTIYNHFKNKTDLVEGVTTNIFENVCKGIDQICSLDQNPIEELYSIKRFTMQYLKNEKASPQHQLNKYYPKIYANLKNKQFEVMQDCVVKNLNKGIAVGMFRDTIDVDFISRIYFHGMMGIKDIKLFPLQKFSMNTLLDHYLEYHLRGICTDKGIKKMNQTIIKNK
ncbi:TetR family transcriptional regulator [Polaribacter pacificus]|uniref:TetR family transcriptional regulator n=1 Tax=Polaribacter pacificus TaxID=1775173 RepID=A0A917HXS9_9FLAO|nr:TetR/AcrR family transcriptional regulator [Polaribacter pacificus]GGG94624.1 TetR family transcriptional regulator [Polaribacter pacificus]